MVRVPVLRRPIHVLALTASLSGLGHGEVKNNRLEAIAVLVAGGGVPVVMCVLGLKHRREFAEPG